MYHIPLLQNNIKAVFLTLKYTFLSYLSSTYLLRFLQVQLFLSLVSWPILLYWGLPLSLAGLVGNFIFTPFLTLFLALSSVIFFCELFYIPNSLLIQILEYISTIWSWLLFKGQRSWLFGCAQPCFLIAVALPLGGCLILHYKKLLHPLQSTALLCLYTLFSFGYLYWVPVNEGPVDLCYRHQELILMRTKAHTLLIDPGALKKIAAPQWVTYTLVPSLIKKGIHTLDYVIMFHPSATAFQSATRLMAKLPVKKLIIPYWEGNLSVGGWKAWEGLLKTSQKHGTELMLVASFSVPYKIGPLLITLEKQRISKNRLRYPLINLNELLLHHRLDYTLGNDD